MNLGDILEVYHMANHMKLQVTGKGQYTITIPRQIVQAMGWMRGIELNFEILGKDKLKIEKVKKPPLETTGGIYDEQ
jgi:bifunctional DNA-binding transcriptional regulator/antitoxin component of YhaV-PrlF toxin-antitoxin module